MDLRTILPEALGALSSNKLRTSLTMLGITIGIAAVICTVAIGEGGSNRIREQLQNLGDNFIWVEAGSRNVQGVRTGTGSNKTLTVRDAQAILQSIPLIKSVAPNADARTQVIYGNQNWPTSYRGVSPEYLSIRRWTVERGASFTQQDVVLSANVCLLGRTVVDMLFGSEDPIGKKVRIGNLPFRVVGILKSKGETATGQDQDDTIFMPYTTAMHKIKGVSWLDDIMCSAVSPEAIRPAREQIVRLLRQRHHLREGAADDFNIRSPEELLQTQQETSRTFTVLLASIASVSLLVGGIGIMNIMLVTVTERTREIGVRRALGATRNSIQSQFLIEALLLCALSGALGVLVGVVTSGTLSHLFGWVTIVPPRAIAIAVVFSAVIGIAFGFYPARKAAMLDPIDALRYE
ncbi:MAG TPA: ABC transporter permease [Thermoanaerobaculia bacterium]|jgi:putative ABC transport system permease protein|nr:ABC transporter permease [Thermoanaerobaculia bacterium]